VVVAIIRTWQAAWKPVRQKMDKTVQVGLFGELLVLQTLMIPCVGPAAVDQWSGLESEVNLRCPISVPRHRSIIMFSVLVVVLRSDDISGPGFFLG
jgi:hypothetical protein